MSITPFSLFPSRTRSHLPADLLILSAPITPDTRKQLEKRKEFCFSRRFGAAPPPRFSNTLGLIPFLHKDRHRESNRQHRNKEYADLRRRQMDDARKPLHRSRSTPHQRPQQHRRPSTEDTGSVASLSWALTLRDFSLPNATGDAFNDVPAPESSVPLCLHHREKSSERPSWATGAPPGPPLSRTSQFPSLPFSWSSRLSPTGPIIAVPVRVALSLSLSLMSPGPLPQTRRLSLLETPIHPPHNLKLSLAARRPRLARPALFSTRL